MKKTVAAIASVGILLSGCGLDSVLGSKSDTPAKVAQAQAPNKPVDNKALPENSVAKVNGKLVLSSVEMSSLDSVIAAELMSQEATKGGLDRQLVDQLNARSENLRRNLFAQAYADNFVSNFEVSDEAAQAAYDRLEENTDRTEYQFKYARFDDLNRAKDAIKDINSSDDPDLSDFAFFTQAQNNKALEWARTNQLPGMFNSVLPRLTKGGTHAKPIPSNQGYFVIYLLDKREDPMPSLEELRPEIERQLQQQALFEHVQDIRDSAVIQIK